MPWNLPRLRFFCRSLASSSSPPLPFQESARRSCRVKASLYNHHHHHRHHHHRHHRLLLDKTLTPSARANASFHFFIYGESVGCPPSAGTMPRTSHCFRQQATCFSFAGSSAMSNEPVKRMNYNKLKMQSLSSSSSSSPHSHLLASFPPSLPSASSSSSSTSAPFSASSANAGKEDTILPMMHHSSSFLQVSLSEEEENDAVNDSFALVVLNHDLPLLTPFLWDKARCRICADGGANRIYDYIPRLLPSEDPFVVRQRYKPDVIKGDLDSIRSEVKDFYAMLGTEILDNSEDQSTTDLSKCLSYVKDSMVDMDESNMKLLVLGALGGRLDHEFANLNSLYLFRKLRVILLSDESMTFLLPKGHKHEIKINPSVEGPYCGLLPLSGSSLSTTTSGLKWNLDGSSMEFGGLISTSNMPVSDHVMVLSDTDLVWTISLQHLYVRLQGHISSINKGGQCL